MKIERKFCALFSLLLLWVTSANAGTRGRDYLGLARECRQALATHPKGDAVGAFATEFGDALPCVEEFLKRGLTNDVRIQLLWDSTHAYKNTSGAAKEAARWEKLALKYPNVHIRLSGACEHNFDTAHASVLMSSVRRAAPHTTYVNSVWRGALLPGVVNEVHGGRPRKPAGRYIVSTDGSDFFGTDPVLFRATYCDDANNDICFAWFAGDNGRLVKTAASPKTRPQAGFPDTRYLNAANAFMQRTTPIPAPSFIDGFNINRTWKQSDPTPGNTGHPCKGANANRGRGVAVLLDKANSRARKLQVFNLQGRLIHQMCYGGIRTEDNSARPMFRSDLPPKSFPAEGVIVKTESKQWFVPYPQGRQD